MLRPTWPEEALAQKGRKTRGQAWGGSGGWLQFSAAGGLGSASEELVCPKSSLLAPFRPGLACSRKEEGGSMALCFGRWPQAGRRWEGSLIHTMGLRGAGRVLQAGCRVLGRRRGLCPQATLWVHPHGHRKERYPLYGLETDSALRLDFGACSFPPAVVLFYSRGDPGRKAGQARVPTWYSLIGNAGVLCPRRAGCSV